MTLTCHLNLVYLERLYVQRGLSLYKYPCRHASGYILNVYPRSLVTDHTEIAPPPFFPLQAGNSLTDLDQASGLSDL